MLRRFIEWWNRKTDEDAEEEAEEFYVEDEYRFETTLVRDLKVISDILGKEFPQDMITDFYVIKSEKRISFYTKEISKNKVMDTIKLKSLTMERYWENISTILWRANYEEYRKVYQSKHMQYANIVRELLNVVKENFDNPDYFYTYCKYEDSIYIVASTLKDEYEHSDSEISEEVFQKAKEIIEKFGKAFMKRYRELEHIEELQKKAVSKSLINRLDNEIDFINNYIETWL